MMQEKAYTQEKMEILEIGCGIGKGLQLLQAHCFPQQKIRWCGVEKSNAAIKQYRKRYVKSKDDIPKEGIIPLVYKGDIEHKMLGFGTDRFDIIFSIQCLQKLQDPVGALNEVMRVLKPQGLLLLADFYHDQSAQLTSSDTSFIHLLLDNSNFKLLDRKDVSFNAALSAKVSTQRYVFIVNFIVL